MNGSRKKNCWVGQVLWVLTLQHNRWFFAWDFVGSYHWGSISSREYQGNCRQVLGPLSTSWLPLEAPLVAYRCWKPKWPCCRSLNLIQRHGKPMAAENDRYTTGRWYSCMFWLSWRRNSTTFKESVFSCFFLFYSQRACWITWSRRIIDKRGLFLSMVVQCFFQVCWKSFNSCWEMPRFTSSTAELCL